MGKEMEKKDYVMDVALKREYSRGYIANMEAAGVAKTAIWLVSSDSTTLTIHESRYLET